LTIFWKFKLAFGFDETDGFFLYTFPGEGSEFQIVADLELDLNSIDATLLYFLNLELKKIRIEFGAGIFIDIDKEKATRKTDDMNSVRYGRISRDDIRKIPVKKDLFQIVAAAAATLDVDTFKASLDIPIDGLEAVKEWIPTLTGSIEAIVKKEIAIGSTSKTKGRRMKESDRAMLESRISPLDHRGLRILRTNDDAIPSSENCPVDTERGEFACVRVTSIELDVGKVKDAVKPILEKFVNPPNNDGLFDQVAVPLLVLDKELPGLSDIAGKKMSALDVAEIFVPKSKPGVDTARKVIKFYKAMQGVAAQLDGDNIILAESCIFKPGGAGVVCEGGAFDFLKNDGSEEALRQMRELQEMEDIFPTYDAGGNRITSVRLLQNECTATFEGPDCVGSCTGCSTKTANAKCKARTLKCKAQNTPGLSFPFLEDPASAIGLLSGKDIQIIDFSPPELVFAFEFELNIVIYTPPTVTLSVFFEFSVTVKFGIVLDSKGIREAVEEKKPLKALNSFAFKDTFDGVDLPLITFEATVGFDIGVSAVIVKIGVSGAVTFTVVLDFYDPFPETSGGLIRPYELLALGSTPLDWFEITLTISVSLSAYVEVGK
jgi:hypothetical protein